MTITTKYNPKDVVRFFSKRMNAVITGVIQRVRTSSVDRIHEITYQVCYNHNGRNVYEDVSELAIR